MNELETYLQGLNEEQIAEFERINDIYTATTGMELGEELERVLESIYADAEAIGSAFHMASIRVVQLISIFQRGARTEGFRRFGPTMKLLEERWHELPEEIAAPFAAVVLQPLDVMIDDPAVPREAIEGYLDQLQTASRRAGHGEPEAALARAYWHAHTGEREACEEWTDRWLTADAPWWPPEAPRTINLTGQLLGGFDPQAALDNFDRSLPAIAGRRPYVMSALVERAGYLALCGRTAEAWRELMAVLREDGLDETVESCPAWAILRASDAAPLQSEDDAVPGALEILKATEESVETDSWDAIENTAAVARFHLVRGDEGAAAAPADQARSLARAYDGRNGNEHHTELLQRRWLK
ncbi:hypothetical protein [Glycomyces salinus]|uniref:hypothetical protein n=1 Tax=Glycomyces salinus TaxID=980294 RepID=UPI0018EB7EA9|nr:hypothetical protein [Glycomyces salinus]